MNESAKSRAQIREDASAWLVRMTSDDVTIEDREQFAKWLAEDPRRESAYRSLERVYNDFAELRYLGDERPLMPKSNGTVVHLASARQSPPPPQVRAKRTRSAIQAIAATLIIAIGGGWILMSGPVSVERYHAATTVAEIRSITLADGSVVTLSAKTELQSTISDDERSVVLNSGQAFFEIAPDRSRPFLVVAGDTRVNVVGTKFDVRMGPEEVAVSVLEGRVKVFQADTVNPGLRSDAFGDEIKLLTAGQKVAAPIKGNLMPVQAVKLDKPGSWRGGVLVYEDAKLLDVIADVNRYYSGTIRFADDELPELRITAVFRPDQVDQMLQTLSRALPLQAVQEGNGRITLNLVATAQ